MEDVLSYAKVVFLAQAEHIWAYLHGMQPGRLHGITEYHI